MILGAALAHKQRTQELVPPLGLRSCMTLDNTMCVFPPGLPHNFTTVICGITWRLPVYSECTSGETK